MPSYSDFKYLQEVNAKCPQISDQKISLILILKDQKLFVKGVTFFSSEIWGQDMRAFTFRFWGQYQWIFETKFFPLKSAFRFPHLTTVWLSLFVKNVIAHNKTYIQWLWWWQQVAAITPSKHRYMYCVVHTYL